MPTNTNAPGPMARPTERNGSTESGAIVTVAAAQDLAGPLGRDEAERIARRIFAADDLSVPAIAELLLLADNRRASWEVRHAADRALDQLDPWEEFLPEPEAFRAFRWALRAYDLKERKKAAAVLIRHLKRWTP